MKKVIRACCLATFLALTSTPGMAQPSGQAARLASVWTGTMVSTTFGTPGKLHHRHPAHVGADKASKGFDYFTDDKFKLLIKQQIGPHLEVEVGNSKHSVPAVATLSADGKMLLVKSKYFTIPFTMKGNKISGCGGLNGVDGTFEHWLNHYAAWCIEAQAQP